MKEESLTQKLDSNGVHKILGLDGRNIIGSEEFIQELQSSSFAEISTLLLDFEESKPYAVAAHQIIEGSNRGLIIAVFQHLNMSEQTLEEMAKSIVNLVDQIDLTRFKTKAIALQQYGEGQSTPADVLTLAVGSISEPKRVGRFVSFALNEAKVYTSSKSATPIKKYLKFLLQNLGNSDDSEDAEFGAEQVPINEVNGINDAIAKERSRLKV